MHECAPPRLRACAGEFLSRKGTPSAAVPKDLRNARRVGRAFVSGVMLLLNPDLDGKNYHSFRGEISSQSE
jgi:hypothetical protein